MPRASGLAILPNTVYDYPWRKENQRRDDLSGSGSRGRRVGNGETVFGAREGVAEAMRRIRESLQIVAED
jgi:hypothetical protein